MPISVKAIYTKGVLKPLEPLALPENQTVSVEVTPLPVSNALSGSLFGAFPELAALTGDEFDWAKRLWEHGLEKQSRILDSLE